MAFCVMIHWHSHCVALNIGRPACIILHYCITSSPSHVGYSVKFGSGNSDDLRLARGVKNLNSIGISLDGLLKI